MAKRRQQVGPPKEKEAWVEGFEKAYWKYLTSQASPYEMKVVPNGFQEDSFSWGDELATQKFTQHMRNCEVDRSKTGMPTDDGWHEFADTFNDPDYRHGLQAHVTCKCNRYRSVKVRYRGTVSDLISGVLDAANVGGEEKRDS